MPGENGEALAFNGAEGSMGADQSNETLMGGGSLGSDDAAAPDMQPQQSEAAGVDKAIDQGQDNKRADDSPYEPFAVPEGVDYDDKGAQEFGALAKEFGLNQTQAQKLVDLHVRHWLGYQEQALQQQEKWRNETMNHPELGGQKFKSSLSDAMRFIDAFGGDKLRAVLNETGVGNHPEIFAAFARAGRMLGEDIMVSGSPSGSKKTGSYADLARSMYPDMNGGNE